MSLQVLSKIQMFSSQESRELCLNVWWFVADESHFCVQWAAKMYFLSGDDEFKGKVLKALASTDFVTAEWHRIPDESIIVGPDGSEIRGIAPLSSVRGNQSFFEGQIFPALARTVPRNLTFMKPEDGPIELEIGREPYTCDTVIKQRMDGKLEIV